MVPKNRIAVANLKEILVVASPLMLQNIFRMMLGTTDRIFVGQLGESALAAVGGADQLFFLFFVIFFAFSGGLAILSSQYLGADEPQKLAELLGTALWCLAFSGVAMTVVFSFWGGTFLTWLKIRGIAWELAISYFEIVAMSAIFVLFSSNYSAIFLALKKNNFPLAATLAAMALNTGLNWIFIFQMGWGVMGAALATTIARVVEWIILHIFLLRELRRHDIRLKSHFSRPMLKKLLHISLPMSIDSGVWQLAMAVHTAIIFKIGLLVAAVFEIIKVLQGLGLMLISSLSHASLGMIGHELGAQRNDRARGYSRSNIILSFAVVTVMNGLILGFGSEIFDLFNISETTRRLADTALWLVVILIYMQVMNIVFPYALRAGGDTWSILIYTTVCFWGLQLPLAWLLGYYLGGGVTGVLLAMIIADGIKGWLFMRRYFQGKWMRCVIGDND